ncbi:hypothetical protein [Streptomyces sp. NPDC086776]|uniref:hypothetical protein n=1 Tax=Streptomyces sp. NPDC086776 TaxID=3365756 RepID=UPI00381634D6
MARFMYLWAALKDGDTAETRDVHTFEDKPPLFYVGKIHTDREAIADLAPLLLGAVHDGRRITRIEVGQRDEGAVLDTVHTITTTRPNDREDTT